MTRRQPFHEVSLETRTGTGTHDDQFPDRGDMIPGTSFTYGDDLEFVRLLEQMKDDKGRTPSQESFVALGGA